MNITARSQKTRTYRLSSKKKKKVIDLTGIVLTAALLLINVSTGFAGEGTDKITEKALYQPGVSQIDEIRDKCDKVQEDFYRCYEKSIQKAGATKEAAALTRLLGEPGYLRDFKKVGPVDIAFVNYPFRANENQGCFLVNGNPHMINVDDLAAITPEMLQKNREYMKLKNRYPEIGLWMGDRTGTGFIRTRRLKGGGARFSVPYRLTKGCRACEDVGKMWAGFYFDKMGNFIKREVIKVQAVKE